MLKVRIRSWLPFVLCIVLGVVAQSTYGSNGDLPKNVEAVHQNTSKISTSAPPTWSAIFKTNGTLNMTMTEIQSVRLTISNINAEWGENYELHVVAANPKLVHIDFVIGAQDIPRTTTTWTGNFSIEAVFLGHTRIYVELRRPHLEPERSLEFMDVIILRDMGILNTVFRFSVGFLVMVLYVNFGSALEMEALKRILLRPVGPVIGFMGQFLIMPILSYLIGYFLFPEQIELRLGLFFTGSTPGGGNSNIFTVVLNGNVNLSVTMTALSNFAAFGMMPLWIFTLGAVIFEEGHFAIPYGTIAMLSFSLLIPLSVGIALQMYARSFAQKLERLLKPLSLALVIFITVFAFTVNHYIFKLFSWKILAASCLLPWCGYIVGWTMATLMRQSPKDALTIAIETGIQNVAIAVFMLHFTLPQPEADITSAVPVASSMMTPLPLLAMYIYKKWISRTDGQEMEEVPTKEPKVTEEDEAMMTKLQKA